MPYPPDSRYLTWSTVFSFLSLPQDPSFLAFPQDPSFLSLPQDPSFLAFFMSLLPQEPLPQEPSLALASFVLAGAAPSSLDSLLEQLPARMKAASAPMASTGVAPTEVE